MEVINDLLYYKDLKIVQNTDWFNFSLDSVLLANFVTINKNTKNILDIGTGNAPIPLILSFKTKAHIYGVEIQKEVYDLAVKSVKLNNLDDRITLYNDDINNKYKEIESDFFDVITCNPPYFKLNGESLLNNNEYKTVARHEVSLDLESIFKVARKVLKNKGIISIVHRADRLIEIIEEMKKYNIEPKRLQLVYPKKGSQSNIVLIEGIKNGSVGLKVLDPLYVHDKSGKYLKGIMKLFR